MSKKIITLFCALVLFLGCGEVLQYILLDDTRSETRLMFHDFYTDDKNIDIVFLGSSHTYRSFVPKVLDAHFGAHTFNAGSSGQGMDGSLVMLQEICAYHKPKRVFLELYHNIAVTDGQFKKRNQMTATYVLSDYMRPSLRKYQFLLAASSPKHYANSFIPARRCGKDIFSFHHIARNIRRKWSKAYRQYQWAWYEKDKDYYVERGFVANDKIAEEGKYWNKLATIKFRLVPPEKNDWRKTLLKIIDFCKENGMELTLVIAPLPEWSIVGTEKYQAYYDYVKEIADMHDLHFYDFNFCNPKYFDAKDRSLFKDEDHLNTAGAELFSRVFADYFTGKISRSALFYDTLKEKLDAEPPQVFGFTELTKDGTSRIISNREHGMEYRLETMPKDGAWRVIQDYSEAREFTIPSGEHGKIVLLWRMQGQEEVKGKIETDY